MVAAWILALTVLFGSSPGDDLEHYMQDEWGVLLRDRYLPPAVKDSEIAM